MKTRVMVIFGGKSVEHEVSVISGIQAIMNMDKEKYDITAVYMTKNNEFYIGPDIDNIEAYKNINDLLAGSRRITFANEDGRIFIKDYTQRKFGKSIKQEFDIAFPIVHGTNVEDGGFQGYLKTLNIPFVGCDVTSAAVGMDKYIQKLVLKEAGVPVLDAKQYVTKDYSDIENLLNDIEKNIGYPVIIKPVNLGSSVGINVAKNRVELLNAVDDAFKFATKILAEHAIINLREINCAVLGDENEAEASECEEPLHSKDILSYEDKYVSNSKGGSKGMASVSRIIPAKIPKELRDEVRSYAIKAFKALSCNGVARIDFLLDEDTGKLYFNEINTIPGSLAFYLWEALDVPYKELLDRMINLCIKRKRAEGNITFAFDINILNNASLSGGAKGGK